MKKESIIYLYCKKNAGEIPGGLIQKKIYFHKLLLSCKKGIFEKSEGEVFSIPVILVELPFSIKEAAAFGEEGRAKIFRMIWKNISKSCTEGGDIGGIWYEPPLRELMGAAAMEYPQEFLLGIYGMQGFREKVILRDGLGARELAWEIYGDLNGLLIYTDQEDAWEELVEKAYEESGLIVQCNRNPFPDSGGNTLFLDFDDREFKDCRTLPKRTVYIDLAPTKEKKRMILAKRKDIAYCDYAKCLDTYKISKL